MSGSGAGIGMGRLMRVARILMGLRQAPTVCVEAAVGATARTAVGRRFETTTSRRSATTTASGSGPSSPQVSERETSET